jgi:hypothetical protein
MQAQDQHSSHTLDSGGQFCEVEGGVRVRAHTSTARSRTHSGARRKPLARALEQSADFLPHRSRGAATHCTAGGVRAHKGGFGRVPRSVHAPQPQLPFPQHRVHRQACLRRTPLRNGPHRARRIHRTRQSVSHSRPSVRVVCVCGVGGGGGGGACRFACGVLVPIHALGFLSVVGLVCVLLLVLFDIVFLAFCVTLVVCQFACAERAWGAIKRSQPHTAQWCPCYCRAHAHTFDPLADPHEPYTHTHTHPHTIYHL